MGDDEDIEKFTNADKETDTVKTAETEENVSDSAMVTKKSESASWVHFDNLKGELLKSFCSLELLNRNWILL